MDSHAHHQSFYGSCDLFTGLGSAQKQNCFLLFPFESRLWLLGILPRCPGLHRLGPWTSAARRLGAVRGREFLFRDLAAMVGEQQLREAPASPKGFFLVFFLAAPLRTPCRSSITRYRSSFRKAARGSGALRAALKGPWPGTRRPRRASQSGALQVSAAAMLRRSFGDRKEERRLAQKQEEPALLAFLVACSLARLLACSGCWSPRPCLFHKLQVLQGRFSDRAGRHPESTLASLPLVFAYLCWLPN